MPLVKIPPKKHCSASTGPDGKVNFQTKGTPCGKDPIGAFHNKTTSGDFYYFACGGHKAALGAACGLGDDKWEDGKK